MIKTYSCNSYTTAMAASMRSPSISRCMCNKQDSPVTVSQLQKTTGSEKDVAVCYNRNNSMTGTLNKLSVSHFRFHSDCTLQKHPPISYCTVSVVNHKSVRSPPTQPQECHTLIPQCAQWMLLKQ